MNTHGPEVGRPDGVDGAHAALLASEEMNRAILAAMPGGVVHVAPDGAILAANPEALRILGLSYDAVTKRYAQDFESETIREDGAPCPAAEYPVTRALLSGEPQPPMTIGVRRPDGSVAWAVFTAVPVFCPSKNAVAGVVVTFLDVTLHRRTEVALRQSEELLRSVLESAPNPIVTADLEGNLLFMNKVPAGLALAQLLGRPAWEYVRAEDQEKAKACMARVAATGEPEDLELTASSGRRWVSRVGPRRNGTEIVGTTTVAWDVTREKELEARLAVADRMASIGTLAAGVAHEINNPLTYLLASLDTLERTDAGRHPATAEGLAAALDGARRIRNVVSDLRSFSYVTEGRPMLLDVQQLLESAIRMAHHEIRHRARVTRRFARTPGVMATDGRLGQVFLNLIVNAAQAIPEGDVAGNEIVVATGVDASGRVVVEITDTGAGIAPEIMQKIFDPFMTTKARGMGTGLGLYICRNVVTALGGELEVRSTPGAGSTFRVLLPAAQAGATPSERPPAEASPSVARRLRILVADDEAAIARMMKAFLDDHDVALAHSGREAIDLLSAREFDLVFCDLIMPDLTGMDVHEHVSAHTPGRESRIVFMTGGAFTERARRFLEDAPNQVLHKPFALDDVVRVVARYGAGGAHAG
jgi:PAS domain S-box-containing protein